MNEPADPTKSELDEINKLYRVHEELVKEQMLRPFEKRALTGAQKKIIADLEFLFSHPQLTAGMEAKIIDVLSQAAEVLIQKSDTAGECEQL